MSLSIRQEKPIDRPYVFELIKAAFAKEKYSDHREQYLVERLRNSEAFIPELSLVAELYGNIVGHILFTKITIKNANQEYNSLALAPVSVLPKYHNEGIGTALIKAGHAKAIELGFTSVVLLGHPEYYPRFGYKLARGFGINLPFEVPDENCMAIELIENALENVTGKVIYAKEFLE